MALTLAEEFLLLAYDESSGRPLAGGTEINCGLAGSLLLELTLHGRVDLAHGRVAAIDRTPVGNPEVDTALDRIGDELKPRKADWWVRKLQGKELQRGLLDGLAQRGVLSEEQHRVLGLFPVQRFPERDPGPELAVRTRLADTLRGVQQADDRTAALLCLVHACRMDRKVFPDIDRGLVKRRMKEISDGAWAGKAVRSVIDSINAAVIAAVVAASTAGGAASG
ncbi:MAG: GPP34 family phosphoprotein [Streptosporangiales bacterium]|nr:GPP34 family phosphoprotein [Streptosporangiales bacterium]